MTAGPVEREIKLAVPDPESALERIRCAGFEILHERVFEANSVYDTPESSIRMRGELLRLREAGPKCTLTWKGPSRTEGGHKERPEVETTVGDRRAFDTILRQLGFIVKFRYEKYRTEFARPAEAGIVTLDETPIGWFLELEGPAHWIDATAPVLGFSPADYITLSYASLYSEFRRRTGHEAEWMVFQR